MADNLAIKGIEDDKPRRRGKKRGRRKSFAIEAHLVRVSKQSILQQLGFEEWWVWGRYETASRRDQAYAVLVKKEQASRLLNWGHWNFRKRDD